MKVCKIFFHDLFSILLCFNLKWLNKKTFTLFLTDSHTLTILTTFIHTHSIEWSICYEFWGYINFVAWKVFFLFIQSLLWLQYPFIMESTSISLYFSCHLSFCRFTLLFFYFFLRLIKEILKCEQNDWQWTDIESWAKLYKMQTQKLYFQITSQWT